MDVVVRVLVPVRTPHVVFHVYLAHVVNVWRRISKTRTQKRITITVSVKMTMMNKSDSLPIQAIMNNNIQKNDHIIGWYLNNTINLYTKDRK